MAIDGPLKYHGGKRYLAKRIVELFPPRVKNPNAPADDDTGYIHYVEPYFGGGAVLLENDHDGISEVANDINFQLMNFWRVVADEDRFARFTRIVEATPFSELEYDRAWHRMKEEVVDAGSCRSALSFFVLCRQSLSGRMKGFTGVTKTRARRGMNNEVSAWLSAIEGLPAVHERLKRVLILNRPAIDVIMGQDGPRTLFYCDPPYMHETRVTTGEYAHEMAEADHSELLEALGRIRGRFLLSGYPSELYDAAEELNGWRHVDFDIANHSSSAKTKQRKTERVWMNY